MTARDRVRAYARRIVGYEPPPPNPMPLLSELAETGHVTLGRRSYGDPRIWRWLDDDGTWLGGDVHIGAFCSIAEGVAIFTGGEHNTSWVTTYPVRVMYGLEGAHHDGHPRSRGDVIIGNDVWLGAESRIMSGVTIGHGAVVGAGAVVDRDVRPYAIVTGNRATEVRRRFDDATVDRLLEMAWWDWPDERIRAEATRLCSPPQAEG